MTYSAVKERLHNYIENGDQKRVKAIYALLEREIEQEQFEYDDATLKALAKISDDAFVGKTITITAKQSMENIKLRRAQNGI